MQNLSRQLLGYKVICWFSYLRPYFNLKLGDDFPFLLNFSAALLVNPWDPPISIVPCLLENHEAWKYQSLPRLLVLVQTPFSKVTQDFEISPNLLFIPPQATRPDWEWYPLASGKSGSPHIGLPSAFNISADLILIDPCWPPVTIMTGKENLEGYCLMAASWTGNSSLS